MGGKRATQEEIDRAIELRRTGHTVEDTASILNRSVYWVYTHTKGMGLGKHKTKFDTKCSVTAENNRSVAQVKKMLSQVGCIPVAYGGYNSVRK